MRLRFSLFVLALVVPFILPNGQTRAQGTENGRAISDSRDARMSLAGRHSVALSIGLLPQVETRPGAAQADGFLGGLTYTYWPHREWGIEVTVSALDLEASEGRAATVAALLVGTSYSPEALALGPVVRPYLTGAVGPYIGTEANGSFDESGSRTETILGARFGGGVDAHAWRWLRVGVRAAYHVVTDYDPPIGSIESPRGAQFSLTLGVTFGGR